MTPPEPQTHADDWLRNALRNALDRASDRSVAHAAAVIGTDPERLAAYLNAHADIDSMELAMLIEYAGARERVALAIAPP